jgi:hypothetical protein
MLQNVVVDVECSLRYLLRRRPSGTLSCRRQRRCPKGGDHEDGGVSGGTDHQLQYTSAISWCQMHLRAPPYTCAMPVWQIPQPAAVACLWGGVRNLHAGLRLSLTDVVMRYPVFHSPSWIAHCGLVFSASLLSPAISSKFHCCTLCCSTSFRE